MNGEKPQTPRRCNRTTHEKSVVEIERRPPPVLSDIVRIGRHRRDPVRIAMRLRVSVPAEKRDELPNRRVHADERLHLFEHPVDW